MLQTISILSQTPIEPLSHAEMQFYRLRTLPRNYSQNTFNLLDDLDLCETHRWYSAVKHTHLDLNENQVLQHQWPWPTGKSSLILAQCIKSSDSTKWFTVCLSCKQICLIFAQIGNFHDFSLFWHDHDFVTMETTYQCFLTLGLPHHWWVVSGILVMSLV